MTTWDELATIEARRREWKDGDWCALHADELFRQGAAWQRTQLRADETMERAARALNLARAALTEAIGDQE